MVTKQVVFGRVFREEICTYCKTLVFRHSGANDKGVIVQHGVHFIDVEALFSGRIGLHQRGT